MRKPGLIATAILVAGITTGSIEGRAPQPLPLRGGRHVVATINSSAISLDEFVMQLGDEVDRPRLQQGRGTAGEMELLERLIVIKLIVEEASTMVLGELPEIRKQIDVSSREILREVLFDRITRNVQPDPAVVETLYRGMVREWKTSSLLFPDDAAAQRTSKQIAGGTPFEKAAAAAIAAKAARADGDDSYHPKSAYLPAIAAAVAALKIGQVSPVIRIEAGSVIVKVTDIRYPEVREARAEARKLALARQKERVLKAYEDDLRRARVVVKSAALKALDYETARPGVESLLGDKRVLATISGAPAVTVGDLTDYLRMQYFHGNDDAKQRKEMNGKKETALHAMISRRLFNAEAQRLGIERSRAYLDRVAGYRDSLVFDTFVQKVIVPDNKMHEAEVKDYYGANKSRYATPEMIKARSLAFLRRDAAEDAARKMREGTDYGWLAANATAQVAPGAKGLMAFDGRPVTLDSVPDAMRKALSGCKSGEVRLYASPEGYYYVVGVQQVVAPTPKPYEDVRTEIAQKLYGEKLKKSVADYAAKLRAHSKVATYLTRA